MWVQLVEANPNTQDYAGMCLRFTQSVFGSPVKYRSAWEAWNATQFKHTDAFPDGVACVVWMSHYGTYGSPPSYENWGHVVTRFADGRFLSSPGSGYGQAWFNSIAEIEIYFNAKYVGWSEDLNGLRIIEHRNNPEESFEEDMYSKIQYADGWAGLWNMATGELAWIGSDSDYRQFNSNLKTYMFQDKADFENFKNRYPFLLPKADLSNVQVNVEGIAQAVADKIDCTCDCGCGIPIPEPVDDVTTKADILEAIETNYPEDK